MTILLIFILVNVFIFAGVVFYNLFTAPVLSAMEKANKKEKTISVLIPVRNEENNIDECLQYLTTSEYAIDEILILNDGSTDNTVTIVNKWITKWNDKNIRLIEGARLPEHWIGKNWACQQLGKEAKGDYLLFIDADVRVLRDAIPKAIQTMIKYGLTMLSVFPSQKMVHPSEYIIVPLMNWLLLTFLPLKKVYSSPNPAFVAANGQFLMFECEYYISIGGHTSVKSAIVEDMEFGRKVKSDGFRMMTLLGGSAVICRMYDSFRDGIEGFSKNFFPGFSMPALPFFLMLLYFLLIFLLPVALIFWDILFIIPLILLAFLRFGVALLSYQPPFIMIILHPFQMLIMFYVGLKSVFLTFRKKRIWKGRNY